jgi:cytochrome oxidase Cu insertion factor (SCO1/SenC/PrrC family)
MGSSPPWSPPHMRGEVAAGRAQERRADARSLAVRRGPSEISTRTTIPDDPPSSQHRCSPLLGIAAAVFGLAAVLAGCGASSAAAGPSSTSATRGSWTGAVLVTPLRTEFMLTSDTGEPYDFTARTAGKVTLLYFGYTNCPDVCPLNMATTAKALLTLSPDQRSHVVVIFVTTDPARDTPQRLRTWLAQFDPAFIGLTGKTGGARCGAARRRCNARHAPGDSRQPGLVRDGALGRPHCVHRRRQGAPRVPRRGLRGRRGTRPVAARRWPISDVSRRWRAGSRRRMA